MENDQPKSPEMPSVSVSFPATVVKHSDQSNLREVFIVYLGLGAHSSRLYTVCPAEKSWQPGLAAAGDTESTVKTQIEISACAPLPASVLHGRGYPPTPRYPQWVDIPISVNTIKIISLSQRPISQVILDSVKLVLVNTKHVLRFTLFQNHLWACLSCSLQVRSYRSHAWLGEEGMWEGGRLVGIS